MTKQAGKGPFVGPHRLPSGRHNIPHTFVAKSQRDRIVAAMVSLCTTRGYARLTIAELAGEAGVSKATFYKHFRDKEACFLDTFEAVTGLFVAETLNAYSTDELEWPEQLAFAIETAFDYMAAHPQEAKVSTVDVMIAGPVAMERYSAARRLLAANVDRGRSYEGSNSDVPPAMASAIVSGGAQLIRRMLLAGEADALPQLGPGCLRWALAPYLGQAEAGRWSRQARRKFEARSAADELIDGST